MPFFIALLMISGLSFAQHSEQPAKEETEDLRASTLVFSIQEVESGRTFYLQRTAQLDHFLVLKERDGDRMKKADSREAKKLDMDFSGRFLKCQYELPTQAGECVPTFKLYMKGETQDICKKDEAKSREMATFFQELKKRF